MRVYQSIYDDAGNDSDFRPFSLTLLLLFIAVLADFLLFDGHDGPHFRLRRPFFDVFLVFPGQGDAVQFQEIAVIAKKALDEDGAGNGIVFVLFQGFQVFPLYIEGIGHVLQCQPLLFSCQSQHFSDRRFVHCCSSPHSL